MSARLHQLDSEDAISEPTPLPRPPPGLAAQAQGEPAASTVRLVKRLAATEDRCVFFQPVLQALRERGLDSDDLLEVIRSDLSPSHFDRTEPSGPHPGTLSNAYALWIDTCAAHMVLALLIARPHSNDARLVVTSLGKDHRYGG